MKIVIQKVKKAHVVVNKEVVGKISHGYVLLVGIESSDTMEDITKAADKVVHMRIFEDKQGKMNETISDHQGSILSISQFTLAADCRKGNRPSFTEAMNPVQAQTYFDAFNDMLRAHSIHVETGIFQTHMNVVLDNDGPITITLNIKDGKVI